MTQIIQELAPCKLNTTVLAIDDLTIGPGIARTLFSHSGNRFASILNIDGADRVMSFRTPFWDAFSLIGFGVLKLTNFEFYLARFLDFIKDPAATHIKFAMAASQGGMAVITGASVSQRGVLMADVSVIPLSVVSGRVDPVAITGNNTLPTLAAEPTLHTLGPCVVDGVRLDGIKSSGFNLNHSYRAEPSDGELYPRTADLMAGEPQMVAEHEDPYKLLSTLGLNGAAIGTAAVWYFRAYASNIITNSGISITASSGRVMPAELGARHRDRARQGVMVEALSSSDTTHPLAVASGVAVPD